MRNDKITNREVAVSFDSIAENFDTVSNDYIASRRYMEISKHSKGKCLEAGAGPGNAFRDIRRIVLTDISYKMCEVANKKHDVKIVCCDAESLPFKKNTFDTIISAEVIYYFDNPEHFIQESKRILKKNGKLIISSANQDMKVFDSIRAILRKFGIKNMYFDDTIQSFSKLQEINKILIRNGFKLKTVKKIILFPFKSFDGLNRIIEKTFLKRFCIFVIIVAEMK